MWERHKKRRARGSRPPHDAEIDAQMKRLAELFVDGAREDGYSFDWDPARVNQLDRYCDELIAGAVSEEVLDSVVHAMGAYLGELLIRNGGGNWAYCVEAQQPRVDMANGLNGYPLNKVAKRLFQGSEQSLEAFYWYGLTREVPPDTVATPLDP